MNNTITEIFTEKAAKPFGHYSQAVIHKDTVYVSVQLGVAPRMNKVSSVNIRNLKGNFKYRSNGDK